MKNKYNITICRTSNAEHTFEGIEAENESEAELIALDLAGNHNFDHETSSDYSVTYSIKSE